MSCDSLSPSSHVNKFNLTRVGLEGKVHLDVTNVNGLLLHSNSYAMSIHVHAFHNFIE